MLRRGENVKEIEGCICIRQRPLPGPPLKGREGDRLADIKKGVFGRKGDELIWRETSPPAPLHMERGVR